LTKIRPTFREGGEEQPKPTIRLKVRKGTTKYGMSFLYTKITRTEGVREKVRQKKRRKLQF